MDFTPSEPTPQSTPCLDQCKKKRRKKISTVRLVLRNRKPDLRSAFQHKNVSPSTVLVNPQSAACRIRVALRQHSSKAFKAQTLIRTLASWSTFAPYSSLRGCRGGKG